jgi:hypothetical protein
LKLAQHAFGERCARVVGSRERAQRVLDGARLDDVLNEGRP